MTTDREPLAGALDEPDDAEAAAPGLPDDEHFLTASEVARLFGRTTRTLRNWERRGVLRPHRIGGRNLYRIGDVRNLIREARRR